MAKKESITETMTNNLESIKRQQEESKPVPPNTGSNVKPDLFKNDLCRRIVALEEENKLLKSLLYCSARTCDNCGNCDCENFQRQRKSTPCAGYISYKDKIKYLEKETELSHKRIEKYKDDLKKLRVAFIQAQAMALNNGKSFEDIIGEVMDITFGVSN